VSSLKQSDSPGRYSIDEYLPFFYDISVECPYGFAETAVYRQQQFPAVPDPLFANFLDAGYRRNGNTLYTMVCPNCSRCTPIRLSPAKFKANRNQKRVWRRNEDVTVSLNTLKITEEKLSLCGEFMKERYPGKGNSAVGYYGTFFANSITNTLEVEYRVDEKLIGVGIIDIGTNWLNGVYFYFDPVAGKRSPGTFNILHLIELCRINNIDLFYLGYLIRDVRAMQYKQNFNPHNILNDGEWILE